MTATPKQRAARKVTAVLVINDLRNAIVAMEMVRSANPNTPVRDAFALARAHAVSALGGIDVLHGEAKRQPNQSDIETFLMAGAKAPPTIKPQKDAKR